MKDRKTITVYVEGKKVTNVKEGLTAGDLAPLFGGNHIAPIIAAKINNRIVQLSEPLIDQCKVDFIDMDSGDGVRIYKRSLLRVLSVPACKQRWRLQARLAISFGAADGRSIPGNGDDRCIVCRR
jgi:hypothetical protein